MTRIAAPVSWRDEAEHRRIIATRFNERLQASEVELGTYTDLTTGSPATVTFEGVPEWATTVELLFSGISLSGSNELDIRMGDSSGIATSGYNGYTTNPAGSTVVVTTTEFRLMSLASTQNTHGVFRAYLADRASYLWIADWQVARLVSNGFHHGAGKVVLTGALTSLQLKSSGSDTFDGGNAVMRYY